MITTPESCLYYTTTISFLIVYVVDENPIRTLGDYSKPSHEGYRNTIDLPARNNVVPLRSNTIRLVQNGCSFHGLRSEDPNQHLKDFLKLVDSLDLDESITIWEDLTTRFLAQFFPPEEDCKTRNDIQKFNKHHGESLPRCGLVFRELLQNVHHHGIDLWLQVQIGWWSLRHSYCMEDPTSFVEYASHLPNEEGRLVSNFIASQDTRLPKFEADFKQQQSEMTNKIDTVLKSITDRIAGALHSDTVKNPKLSTTLVFFARSYPIINPQCSSHPSTSINAIKAHLKEATISKKSMRRAEIEIKPQ
ncbi:zinc finger, CCHC-type containing protein [Tanacetum coccineum]